jgi:hypothetical protein
VARGMATRDAKNDAPKGVFSASKNDTLVSLAAVAQVPRWAGRSDALRKGFAQGVPGSQAPITGASLWAAPVLSSGAKQQVVPPDSSRGTDTTI